MDGSRKSNRNSLSHVKDAVATSQPKDTIVHIRALYPSIIKYAGQVTGKPYVWNGAGDVVGVDADDAPFLLSKKIGGRSCCGGLNPNGNKLFEKV